MSTRLCHSRSDSGALLEPEPSRSGHPHQRVVADSSGERDLFLHPIDRFPLLFVYPAPTRPRAHLPHLCASDDPPEFSASDSLDRLDRLLYIFDIKRILRCDDTELHEVADDGNPSRHDARPAHDADAPAHHAEIR